MRCVNEKLVKVTRRSDWRSDSLHVGCGKCYACRYNRTQQWIDRIEMESIDSRTNPLFLTVTYRDECLPLSEDNGLATLCLRDVQLYLKRLRKAIYPLKVRYVYVGEYGGRTCRPHYHFILFSSGPFDHSLLESTWGLGHVRVSMITPKRIAYVASFHINSAECPTGRALPFSQYSRNPGIGYSYVEKESNAKIHLQETPDLRYIRLNGTVRPLPSYIRKKYFPDGYPLPIDREPLFAYLNDRYPDLPFHEAVDYVNTIYKHRLTKQLKKHGKYIRPSSSSED